MTICRQRPLGPHDPRTPARRRRHGLTSAEQDALRAAQGGLCAICLRPEPRLLIDHDHRHCAGQEGCPRCVRGYLCNGCNSALGWLGGDANIPRLVTYLTAGR
jgi:recombination endonuclease VII